MRRFSKAFEPIVVVLLTVLGWIVFRAALLYVVWERYWMSRPRQRTPFLRRLKGQLRDRRHERQGFEPKVMRELRGRRPNPAGNTTRTHLHRKPA
jgi:hypothetical protein